jgi:single-strand DNA-binding protein
MQNLNNSVRLIGNLGKDVEVKNFESGTKKATINLATTEKYTNAEGEAIESTQWHKVIAWGKIAEHMATALKRGSRVSVEGEIQYKKYTDTQGVVRNITEIKAREFTPVQ